MNKEKNIYIYTTVFMIIGFLAMYFFIRYHRVLNSDSSISPQRAPTYTIGSSAQSIAALDSSGNLSQLSFPTGMIMIWYPPDTSLTSLNLLTIASSVPSGWAICDGSKGTPDLRGRFVLMAHDTSNGTYGSATHPIGQTGGEEKHVLTISEMPTHSHAGVMKWPGGGPGVQQDGNENARAEASGLTEPKGDNMPHKNMTPYYTLVYVMKL